MAVLLPLLPRKAVYDVSEAVDAESTREVVEEDCNPIDLLATADINDGLDSEAWLDKA